MSEHSPFNAAPDPELGAALREALAMPAGTAFVTRVRARLGQRGWEEELSGWFWQGLVAASLATVLAGWGWSQVATADQGEASVASQLLDGRQPGAEVLLATMSSAEKP